MTYPRFSFIALVFTIALYAAPLPAQQRSSTQTHSAPSTTELREKAFSLLETLESETATLQSAENRVRMRSNIAASLWPHNEQKARSLIASVEADIKAELQAWLSDMADEGRLRVFVALRMDTAERIAKRDPQLAMAFFKGTDILDSQSLPYGVRYSQHAFELRLAKLIISQNPEAALKLSRESLARGFSDDLRSLLGQLHKKDRERGLILYREIVDKIRSTDLIHNWQDRYFAQALARSFKPPAVDEPTFRQLINTFIDSALQHCGNSVRTDNIARFCWEIGTLMPVMESVDPLRTAQLKRWVPEGAREPMSEAFEELQNLSQNGTVDEILELASKHPQIEAAIQWSAMIKAETEGDVARARQIARRYDRNPEQQRRMLAHLDGDPGWATIDDEQLALIQRRLSTIKANRERVSFLVSIAARIGVKDEQFALRLLKQATEIVDTMIPGKEQTEAQIVIAIMYCHKKSDLGFVMMEPLVPKLNELIGAAMKLDGYDNRYVRDGEWNMSAAGGLGTLLTALAHSAGSFASCDFDRSVRLAAQFERPEIRMMAQLKLAQGILDGPTPQSFIRRVETIH